MKFREFVFGIGAEGHIFSLLFLFVYAITGYHTITGVSFGALGLLVDKTYLFIAFGFFMLHGITFFFYTNKTKICNKYGVAVIE